MGFELVVVNNTPMTAVGNVHTVAVQFFTQVGYLPAGGEAAQNVQASAPYRLLVDCFLRQPARAWTVDELVTALEASRPTLYRHLNKLKALDLLEEDAADAGAEGRKTYRLRYGNLSKAWNFVETNVRIAMEYYRLAVDQVHDLAARETGRPAPAKSTAAARPERTAFELRVVSGVPAEHADLESAVADLFTRVGYLPEGEDATALRATVPFKMLVDFFLRRPDKAWTLDELITGLNTSRPTVYRHLNKLKALDLVEEDEQPTSPDPGAGTRKTYRLRYGNLSKAWNFVEANVTVATGNYRQTVDHLHALLAAEARSAGGVPKASSARATVTPEKVA